MKNLSLFALRAAAVLAMTATMVACSDNDPEEPTTPGQGPDDNPPAQSAPITIVENPTYNSIGAYYGDYNDAGTGRTNCKKVG